MYRLETPTQICEPWHSFATMKVLTDHPSDPFKGPRSRCDYVSSNGARMTTASTERHENTIPHLISPDVFLPSTESMPWTPPSHHNREAGSPILPSFDSLFISVQEIDSPVRPICVSPLRRSRYKTKRPSPLDTSFSDALFKETRKSLFQTSFWSAPPRHRRDSAESLPEIGDLGIDQEDLVFAMQGTSPCSSRNPTRIM